MKTPQLLAPAGNMECLRAAVENGCDAVYLGGKDFSARKQADNFAQESLSAAIEYCHLRGVQVYITINTLYTTTRLPSLLHFIQTAYQLGADAFIVQDIGVAMLIHREMPLIPLHASTQMTAKSPLDVACLKSMGFQRVVLGREMDLESIRQSSAMDIETECFVHGALCVCLSGQCFMSSFIGKRSGNQGMCAQPCRKPYRLINRGQEVAKGYLLSPKDLMTLQNLEKIVAAGVHAVKIEGRMKKPEYVAQVTAAYRQQLDSLAGKGSPVDEETLRRTAQVFNRGAFTQGYFNQHSGPDMMSADNPKPIGTYLGKVLRYDHKRNIAQIFVETDLRPGDGIEIMTQTIPHPGCGIDRTYGTGEILSLHIKGDIRPYDAVHKSYDKQVMDELKHHYMQDTRKTKLEGIATIYKGQPAALTLKHPRLNIEITCTGPMVEKATNTPLTKERLLTQLSKTGATPFEIEFSSFDADEDVFINLGQLNQLRRETVSKMESAILSATKRVPIPLSIPEPKPFLKQKPGLTAYIRTPDQFQGVKNAQAVSRIYMEVTGDFAVKPAKYVELAHSGDAATSLYAALPLSDHPATQKFIDQIEATEMDGYLVRDYGTLALLDGTDKDIILDYTFNILNTLSTQYLAHSAHGITLSVEATTTDLEQMAVKASEIVIHGKIPVMTTRQCPVGNFIGKKDGSKYCSLKNQKGSYALVDEKGVSFSVAPDCIACMAQIYSDRPIFMLHKLAKLVPLGPAYLRLAFSDETQGQAYEIATAYKMALENGDYSNATTEQLQQTGFTYGHYFNSTS